MTQARGSYFLVTLTDETTLGTADGTTSIQIPTISYDVKLTQPLMQSNALRGTRHRTAPYLGEKTVAGTWVIQPDARSIAHIFRHAIAVPVTTGGIGGTPVITAPGSGYTSATVAFSGGTGSGATATVQVAAGEVTGITITNPGSGYTVGAPPTATISGDGTGATATVALAVYTHEYKPGVLPVGFTLEPYFSDLAIPLQHTGCRVNGFSFSVGTSGCLEMTLDIVGVDETNAARLDSAPILYAVEPLKYNSVVLSQTGSTLRTATKFDVNFGNDLEQVRTIGNGGKIYSLPEGFADSSGAMEVLFESMTQYNKAKNETEDSLKIELPSPATGTYDEVELEWQEVRYAVGGVPVQGPNGVRAPLDWQAHYENGSEASSFVARVTNGLSSVATIPAS